MVSLDREARVRAAGERSHLHTIRTLLPYLWPRGALEMRGRVVLAVLLLVGAKVANVYVPLLYKDAVDILADNNAAVIVVPVAILLAYGALRVLTVAFGELRDAVFAKVGERAIRTVALRVFSHLHTLSLRFHIERRTGGLSRAIERGIKGIEFLLTFMLFNILPTLVEVTMVCGILWFLYGITYAAVTFVTIGVYIAFTLSVTEWRLKYRRRMNEKDSEANTKAIDSLLNYETVKYFGNEAHEARRFDVSRRLYEQAAVQSKTSLSLLNIGQGIIVAIGLTGITIMAGNEVAAGTMTIGDFVLVNTYLLQLYIPLNFLGFVYREIKQSLTDMEAMFGILSVNREVEDAPGAEPLSVTAGAIEFDDVRFPLRGAARHPRRHLVQRGAGHHDRHRGPERRRQVDHLAHPLPLLRHRVRLGQDRRPGRAQRASGQPARGHRDRSPGHGALQRHDLLQHRLRPAGGEPGGGGGGGAARPHPRFHREPAGRL